jgi:hypothetical protein
VFASQLIASDISLDLQVADSAFWELDKIDQSLVLVGGPSFAKRGNE